MRRASTAVEFAVALPLVLIVVAGVIDLGQYLYLADAVAAAVSEGARAGALADPEDGEDPLRIARETAEQWWTAAELPQAMTATAVLAGEGPPDELLIVTGTVPFDARFVVLGLPIAVTCSRTVRLYHQPDETH